MAAPPKPWEVAGVSGLRDTLGTSSPYPSACPMSENRIVTPSGIQSNSAPPILPPRPYQSRTTGYGMNSMPYGGMGGMGYGGYSSYGSMGGLGGYGSSYGGYGGYGGYGNYGSYSGFGGMYGGGGFNRSNGMFGDVESRFIHLAEESSRPAFQSIESVVGAVGSIAMMLENTFFAMTSSFRAILGVAENFGRLRTLFAQFWSAFAVVRGINWLLKKLLVLLGIRTEDEFKAWAEASLQTQAETSQSTDPQAPRTSSWPALLFIAVIAAVPYIIVRMLGSINATIQGNMSNPTTWQNPMQALAQYDFQATSPQEISFGAHQILTIAPESLQGNLWNSGWLLASVDQKTSGLVPVNYFKIIRNPSNPQAVLPPLPAAPKTNLSQSTESSVKTAINENKSPNKEFNMNESIGPSTDQSNLEAKVNMPEKCPEGIQKTE